MDADSGDGFTYAQLKEVIHNVAGHLQSLGFHQGCNMAISATNCVEIEIVQFASWELGGMVTLVNPLLQAGPYTIRCNT